MAPGPGLHEHRKRCEKMAEKYGRLYDCFEEAAQRGIANDDVDEWRNMRAIYEHFRTRFIEGMAEQRENAKRRKLNGEAADKGEEELP